MSSIDEVFLPVLSGDGDHYSCICINFITEQLEYFVHRKYTDDLMTLPYGGIAKIIADEMGKYMVDKGLEKGRKVSGFKLVNIEFKWQGVGYSENDCGIYLMAHMLLYCGQLFDCTLGTRDAIDMMRAEIAATLVLSDVIKHRAGVLSRVAAFKEVKARECAEKRASMMLGKRGIGSDAGNSGAKLPRPETSGAERTPTTFGVGRSSVMKGSTPVMSRSCGKGDGLGCSLEYGGADDNLLLVSKTLKLNKSLIKDIDCLRKQVADFCFLDDYSNVSSYELSFPLVYYGRYAKLNRGEILNMLVEVPMYDGVIECWSFLLNRLETEECKDLRLSFFGILHMV